MNGDKLARVTHRAVPDKWRAREPFNANDSLRGFRTINRNQAMLRGGGWLNAEWLRRFQADRDRIAYVVLSYDTPIAWVLLDGTEVRVTQRFSQTTGRHQSLVR